MPFKAILFDPGKKDASLVSVRALGSSLEATGESGAFRIDGSKCALTAAGWDSESIQIVWTGEGGAWALSSKDPEARSELGRISQFQVALETASRARQGARRSGRLGLTLLAVLTLLPLLVLLVLFALRDRIIDMALERIPVSVDREVGKMFEGQVLGSKQALPESEATRAIALIVEKLKAASPDKRFEFKLSVQRNHEVNAFAAPGGLIVVHTGLMNAAGSAEEVAGVLAHEMAHATKRHSMRQLLYRGGLLPLMGLLIGQPDAAALFQNLGQLSELKFSRTQEEDADRIGFDTLVAAGISTEGMAVFFDRLARMGGTPPSFLSTHPSSSGRAEAIRERAKTLGTRRAEPLPIDWNVVQASIR